MCDFSLFSLFPSVSQMALENSVEVYEFLTDGGSIVCKEPMFLTDFMEHISPCPQALLIGLTVSKKYTFIVLIH